jgi:hypothetical protein
MARQYDKKNICQECSVVVNFARVLQDKVERTKLLTMHPRIETQLKLEGMAFLNGFVKSHIMIVVIIVDVTMER